jgi:hypothetical protein
MGRSLRPWGMGKPAPWAAGGPRVHTYKQFAQPNILALLSGRFEALCMRRKRVAEYS